MHTFITFAHKTNSMKKHDFWAVACVAVCLLPFFLSDVVWSGYQSLNASHGMLMSFFKFALLSTAGELVGMRISTGRYLPDGFGVLPRALVWGFLGMGINMAMMVFASGVPAFLAKMGAGQMDVVMNGPLSWSKCGVALLISASMNCFFAPVFMTVHKVTDSHILATGGTLRGFFSRMDVGALLQGINWRVQWGFVFKKTIPLFWLPAHTVTFLLPGDARVLFAALLGVILGIILAVASRKGDR